MSIVKIEQALIQSYIGAGLAVPTIYENTAEPETVATAKTTQSPWAELFFISNQPDVATLGSVGTDAQDGLIQLNLNFPLNKGRKATREAIELLSSYYTAGRSFSYQNQSVSIRSCGAGNGRNVDGWYQTIITITWKARTPRIGA